MDKFNLLGDYLDDADYAADLFITQRTPEHVPDQFWEGSDDYIDEVLAIGKDVHFVPCGASNRTVSSGVDMPGNTISSKDSNVENFVDNNMVVEIYQPIVEDISSSEDEYK